QQRRRTPLACNAPISATTDLAARRGRVCPGRYAEGLAARAALTDRAYALVCPRNGRRPTTPPGASRVPTHAGARDGDGDDARSRCQSEGRHVPAHVRPRKDRAVRPPVRQRTCRGDRPPAARWGMRRLTGG